MERHTNHGQPENGEGRERTRGERQLRAEVIERLPETPENASQRAIEVIGAMMGACVRAHSSGQPLPEQDATGIAHFLALAVDEGEALRRFANSRPVLMSDVRTEYLEIARRPNVYPETRAVIDWLGNYVLTASYPEFEPAAPNGPGEDWQHAITFKEDLGLTVAFHVRGPDQEVRDGEALMTRIERFALDHGSAGLAFLRLPTTDAGRTDLDAQFTRAYVNSYESVDSLMAAHFHLFRIEDDQSTTPVGFDELAAERQEELYAQAGQHLALIEVAGQLHAFHRHAIEYPPDQPPEEEHPYETEL